MTKRRPVSLREDSLGKYYLVPIGGKVALTLGLEAHIDVEDLDDLVANYGEKSFFRNNSQICIKVGKDKLGIARLLLDAGDGEVVEYADNNSRNLRRHNISIRQLPDSAARGYQSTTENSKTVTELNPLYYGKVSNIDPLTKLPINVLQPDSLLPTTSTTNSKTTGKQTFEYMFDKLKKHIEDNDVKMIKYTIKVIYKTYNINLIDYTKKAIVAKRKDAA